MTELYKIPQKSVNRVIKYIKCCNLFCNISGTSRATSIYLSSKFFTKGLAFLLIPVWTGAFTPSEYGIIGTLVAWVGVLTPIVMLGLPSALIRLKTDCHSDKDWHVLITSVSIVILASAFLLISSVLAVGPWIWNMLKPGGIPYWPYVPMALTGIFLSSLGRVALATQQANQRPGRAIFYEQLLGLGTIILALIFVVFLGYGVVGYLLGGLIGGGICSLIFLNEISKFKAVNLLDKAKIKLALAYGLPLIPQALAVWILGLSDRIMIEQISGLSEAGLYNLAANFGIIVSMVAISINQAITPSYFQRARHNFASQKERKIALRLIVIKGFISLVGIFILIATSGPIVIGWLINERYFDAIPLLVPLLGGCFFFGISQFFMLPLLYKKKPHTLAYIFIFGAIANVSLNLYYIPQYGASAAAYTTLLSYALTCFLACSSAYKNDWFGLSFADLILIVGGALLSILLCLLFNKSTASDYFWRLSSNLLLFSGFAFWFLRITYKHKHRV